MSIINLKELALDFNELKEDIAPQDTLMKHLIYILANRESKKKLTPEKPTLSEIRKINRVLALLISSALDNEKIREAYSKEENQDIKPYIEQLMLLYSNQNKNNYLKETAISPRESEFFSTNQCIH